MTPFDEWMNQNYANPRGGTYTSGFKIADLKAAWHAALTQAIQKARRYDLETDDYTDRAIKTIISEIRSLDTNNQ